MSGEETCSKTHWEMLVRRWSGENVFGLNLGFFTSVVTFSLVIYSWMKKCETRTSRKVLLKNSFNMFNYRNGLSKVLDSMAKTSLRSVRSYCLVRKRYGNLPFQICQLICVCQIEVFFYNTFVLSGWADHILLLLEENSWSCGVTTSSAAKKAAGVSQSENSQRDSCSQCNISHFFQ